MGMASTSRDRMPVLPRGWSRHASSSCPGRFYFFNTETGAKTWDIRDIISGKDLPKEASTKDINEPALMNWRNCWRRRRKESAWRISPPVKGDLWIVLITNERTKVVI